MWPALDEWVRDKVRLIQGGHTGLRLYDLPRDDANELRNPRKILELLLLGHIKRRKIMLILIITTAAVSESVTDSLTPKAQR